MPDCEKCYMFDICKRSNKEDCEGPFSYDEGSDRIKEMLKDYEALSDVERLMMIIGTLGNWFNESTMIAYDEEIPTEHALIIRNKKVYDALEELAIQRLNPWANA